MTDVLRRLAAPSVALLLILPTAAVSRGEDAPPAAAEAELWAPPHGRADLLGTALDVLLWGQKAEDPEAIALAARLLSNAMLVSESEVRVAGEPFDGDHAPLTFLTPQDLLDEAVALASKKGDRKLAKRLARIELPGNRGTTHPGTLYCRETIPAGKTYTYRVEFEEVRPAQVELANLGDGPLTMAVLDLSGNIVAHTSRRTPDSMLWHPETTAPFLIKIRNPGQVEGRYVLMSN